MKTRFAGSFAALCTLLVLFGCKGQAQEKTAGKEPSTAAAPGTNAEPVPPTAAKAVTPMPPPQAPVAELPKDTQSHEGKHLWSMALGGLTTDAGRSLAISKSGTIALGGYFSGKSALGAESLEATKSSDPKDPNQVDGFVSTFGAQGKPEWTRQLGGAGSQIVSSVAFDGEGNLIAAGWFGEELTLGDGRMTTAGADDIFVVKFGPDGRRLWAKRFGSTDVDGADDMAVDAAGNIYVTGVFRTEADFAGTTLKSSGLADIFLLKLTKDGEVAFVKAFGERYDDFGRSIAIDSQGNIVLFGEFSSKTSFGGEPLESVGNRDLFIAKLTPSGDHIWSKGMGTTLDEMGLAVATDPTDAIVITGSFEDKMSFGGEVLQAQGRGDIFVARYDRDGSHLWSKRFGGKDEDIGNSIATDDKGNIAVTGWFRNTIDFGGPPLKSNAKQDSFIVKLGPSGQHLWSKSYGGKENDTGRVVACTSDGSLVASGTFRYNVSFGGKELPYAKEEGGYIPYADVYLLALGH